ncbi:hypothetical protein GTW43_15650 [Streptomyces sp. SID5785]|uniref:DUF6479 family protein n=1 Tax=Streptomyces sp. SID5785 TaxID=2690309 RepID=UPI001361E5CC|nr:DUF6479 family protein [Streptomyces sp. SID5785]MZD06520.1 hypothetical protein [Streptomyces sp. SID5785]
MNATYVEVAMANSFLSAFGAFIGGLFIAGFLILAVRVGMRVLQRESRRPRPDEQPHLPKTGAVHEIREMREPDVVPLARNESERLMPYELHPAPTKRSDDQRPRLWTHGPRGSLGHT